jgi:hypothetical protein
VIVDDHAQAHSDISPLMEMTHEAMLARFQQGLVTPMSPTINTFAKTDGTWWTAGEKTWQRVAQPERNQQLDCHHDRFGSVHPTKGAPAMSSPWRLAD